jgi:polysaccharide export outer membrane protein
MPPCFANIVWKTSGAAASEQMLICMLNKGVLFVYAVLRTLFTIFPNIKEETMNKAIRIFVFTCILLVMAYSAVMAEEYRFAPGDILSIGVYGYEELQVKELVIRPDGKLAFPLVGECEAKGLTVGELTKNLTVRLSEFIRDPQVTVNVDKFHTTRIYVLGEVNKPGMYEIEKQHNVLDAIGAAGGYTQKAAKKRVFVIKQSQPDRPVVINLFNLLQRADVSQNIALTDGDIVYLTRNRKIIFSKDILPFITAMYQVKDMNN